MDMLIAYLAINITRELTLQESVTPTPVTAVMFVGALPACQNYHAC